MAGRADGGVAAAAGATAMFACEGAGSRGVTAGIGATVAAPDLDAGDGTGTATETGIGAGSRGCR